jgi:hypothetical protein
MSLLLLFQKMPTEDKKQLLEKSKGNAPWVRRCEAGGKHTHGQSGKRGPVCANPKGAAGWLGWYHWHGRGV